MQKEPENERRDHSLWINRPLEHNIRHPFFESAQTVIQKCQKAVFSLPSPPPSPLFQRTLDWRGGNSNLC